MADPFYGYDEEETAPKGHDNLFIWTVFILLLIGLAFACWLGSFYIFGHPEQPRAYRILKKLKKIEAPRRFEVTAAPPGEFLSAQKLFERYSKFSRLELERENAELLRNFINNYRETKKLVPYVKGNFTILDSYELAKKDLFSSGVVALAQSSDFPQVLIEHVFTAPGQNVSRIRATLQPGLLFPIYRTNDLSAVIHIEKVFEGRLMFTLMPLSYAEYGVRGGVGYFRVEPPVELNLEGGVPLTKSKELQEGFRRYAEYRRRVPGESPETIDAATRPPTGPELVRLDTVPDGVKAPLTGALPEMPVATPIPITSGAPRSGSREVLAMNTTPRPAATPGIAARSTIPNTGAPESVGVAPPPVAAPTPVPRVSPDGVPLTPFIASKVAPGLSFANSGNWRTYAPGRLPPGRSITPREASELADRGDLGERIYLRGQFVVTASAENKAVLRPQAAAGEIIRPVAGGTRILVDYPRGAVPPNEGTTFARDDSRPFEIRDVQRGADGVINIYVREITEN